MLSNIPGTRQVFERWMAWEPDEKAWSAYIKMEVRYNEFDRASKIFERLVSCHPEAKVCLFFFSLLSSALCFASKRC